MNPRGRRENPAVRGWAALAATLLVILPACTFEQTGGAEEEETLTAEAPPLVGEEPGLIVGEELALHTVRLFRESVATGDLSLALSLLDRDAGLIDPIAEESSEWMTRGELLLELRRRHADGLQFELLESEISILAEGAALVVSRLAVLQEGADGFGEEVGRVDETVLLVATPEGWRIRHLHRSLRPGQ